MVKVYKLPIFLLIMLALSASFENSHAQQVAPAAYIGLTIGVMPRPILYSPAGSIVAVDCNDFWLRAWLYVGYYNLVYQTPLRYQTIAFHISNTTKRAKTAQTNLWGQAEAYSGNVSAPSCEKSPYAEMYYFYATWGGGRVKVGPYTYDLPAATSDTVKMNACNGIWYIANPPGCEDVTFAGDLRGIVGMTVLW